MSALGYAAIRDRLTTVDHKSRLVVSPILDPAKQLKPSQSGVDVRLGRAFALARPWGHGVAERLEADDTTREPPIETVVLDFGEPMIVHPHQFVLARTLEFLRLPHDLQAHVIGRSSWGRRGLIVATAVLVHPGFVGPITLELKNVGEVPIALYPMDLVAQLAFFHVPGGEQQATTESQFSATYVPVLGKVRDEKTRAVISSASNALRRRARQSS